MVVGGDVLGNFISSCRYCSLVGAILAPISFLCKVGCFKEMNLGLGNLRAL